MQADYKLLPKRTQKPHPYRENWKQFNFLTNLYEVDIDMTKNTLYQYSIEIEEIPDDSSELYFRAVKSIKPQLQETVKLLSWRGKMMWALKPCKDPMIFRCQFSLRGHSYKYEAFVQQNRILKIHDIASEQVRVQILQVLNVRMKQQLQNIGMTQLGRSKQYYSTKQCDQIQISIYDCKLNVLSGYKFTLVPICNKIYLQIDVCSRVLQAKTLLNSFKDIDESIIGKTIFTLYGKHRVYTIEEVDYSKNPKDTFYHEKLEKDITFKEYYEKFYNLKVYDLKQPLVKVLKRIKQEVKNQEVVKTSEYIYLLPEFVVLTGMTPSQKTSLQMIKQVEPYTKLSPAKRVRECSKMIEEFNNDKMGLIKIGSQTTVKGFAVDRPKIQGGEGETIRINRSGNLSFKSPVKKHVYLDDWILVYSVDSPYGQKVHDEADQLVSLLQQAGKVYGIQLEKPGFTCIKENHLDRWIEEMEKQKQRNGVPQFIICYLAKTQDHLYSPLKKYITNQLKISSQIILKKSVCGQEKNRMSIASKILIQIQAKLGGIPWEVCKKHPYFERKRMMYGALSFSKSKEAFTLAFVGTLNSEATQTYNECYTQLERKEQVPLALFYQIFSNWMKEFEKKNKFPPQVIIIYRDCLSDEQTKIEIEREIEALNSVVQKRKAKDQRYSPKFIYILVNKTVSSRFYIKENNEIVNPPSGSVIVEPLSKDNAYDFHLAAQFVAKGSCNPTQYRVAYESEEKIPQEAVISFTYEQCFNYFNWEGAVRVPACLQYADKLAYQVGEKIKENIPKGENQFTMHYL